MVEGGFKHTGSDGSGLMARARRAGYSCATGYIQHITENIHRANRRWGEDSADIAAGLVDGWMRSSGHRANILRRDSERIGVGVFLHERDSRGRQTETIYATQNFLRCADER